MVMWTQVEKLGDHIRDRILVSMSLTQWNVMKDMLIVWVEQNIVVWTSLNDLLTLFIGPKLFKILVGQSLNV
jgi:hypothetical protein